MLTGMPSLPTFTADYYDWLWWPSPTSNCPSLYTPSLPTRQEQEEGPLSRPLIYLHTTQTLTNIYCWNKTYNTLVAYLVSPCPFLCSRPVSVLSSPPRCSQCSSQIHCGPAKSPKDKSYLLTFTFTWNSWDLLNRAHGKTHLKSTSAASFY